MVARLHVTTPNAIRPLRGPRSASIPKIGAVAK
jgi:hypothetical protein